MYNWTWCLCSTWCNWIVSWTLPRDKIRYDTYFLNFTQNLSQWGQFFELEKKKSQNWRTFPWGWFSSVNFLRWCISSQTPPTAVRLWRDCIFFKGDKNSNIVVIYIVLSRLEERVTWPLSKMVDRITGCTWWPVFLFSPFYISYFACDSD